MAKRRTARAGARKRKSAGGVPKKPSMRARRPAVRNVEATSGGSGGDGYATIGDVARRAESDPDFFKAIIRGRAHVNEVLAREGLQLSPADALTLEIGLGTIIGIAQEFKGLGGWGRWPVMPSFD